MSNSDIPDDLNKKVTRELHNQGIEMTPDEVSEEQRKALEFLREKLRAKGYEMPEGDMEFLRLIKRMTS